MATKLGSVIVDFTARTAGFQKGLEEVQAGMKKTRKTVESNAASIKAGISQINTALSAIGIGVSVGAVVNGLKAVGAQILAVKDGATELGTSFKDFQVLQYAAEYSEESIKTLTSALDKLDNNIQKARNEGGSAAKTFRDMGVSIDEINALSAGQRFTYIAQDIKSAIDPSARFAQWAELLGEKALPKLKEALDNASVGYAELARKTEQVGVISDETIKKYDEFVKRWDKGKKTLVVGLIDLWQKGSFNIDLMTGKLDEMADQLSTNAEKSDLYTKAMIAMEGLGGFSKEKIASVKNLAVQYNLLASEERFQAAQAEKAAAEEKKHITTLGETKDSVAALSEKYGDSASHLQSLISLSNTALGKGADAARVIQNAISAATDAVTKDTAKMTDSLKTPYEKFLEMEKELQRRVDLKIPGADSLIKSFRETNPVIKETQTALNDFDTTLASVDAEAAYIIKLREINTQIKEWSANAAIGSQRAEELGAKMRQAAYEQANAKEMATAEDVKKFIRTPSQVREQDVADITNNQFLKSDEKDTAISEINTGFVTMRNSMIASAEELQNNTNLWGGLRDAAADATVQFNAATNVEQLHNVQASLEATREKYSALGQVGYAAVQSLSAGFARLIVEGGSVKDMLGGVVKMIAEMMIQYALMSAFKSMGFGGMFAGGGDVNPNKLYVVGEKGPELFSPKARGTIINQDQIASKTSGGSGAPVIQFNLSAYDTTGMSQMIDSKTPSIVAQALRQWKYENARGKM